MSYKEQPDLYLHAYSRTRKVKCDEAKPECIRCSKFGTACRYAPLYDTPCRKPKPLHSNTFVAIKPRLAALLIREPSNSIPGDESERRYFDLYREKLAYDLCGYFESPFWTHLIPQECHHEPAVRHAIFALSALYKASASKIDALDSNNEHLDFALVQQSKAISFFRKSLSGGRPQVRLALMASLLFGSFESFHGNLETASRQIYSGLNILGQWQKNKVNRQSSQGVAIVDPELGVALSRLQLQFESFLAMNPMNDNPIFEAENEEFVEDIPFRFITLSEAFPFAIRIAIGTLRYMRKASRYGNDESFNGSLERERDSLGASIDQWKKAFRPIFLETETQQNTANRDYLGVFQLHTCISAFDIILQTALAKEERIFDRFTEQFRRIVSLCRRLLEIDQELRTLDGLRAQFGMGLIMTLYYVATRCRDSLIRWDAIDTLREWPRMNGIWDSLQTAKVAEWIVKVEEEESAGNTPIPEGARVRMNSLKVVAKGGGIDVECMQGSSDGVSKLRMANLVLS